MAKFSFLVVVFFFILHLVLITSVIGKKISVPAFYVFGDSGTDVGNNNYPNTVVQVKDWPSGMDLNNRTGRFTNCKTIADFIAIMLGLPMAPAYLSLHEAARSKTISGISYSSGGCGILEDTGLKGCLTFHQQIRYFSSTVKKDFPKAIKRKRKLSRHLSKSIFLIIIGANDFNGELGQIFRGKFNNNTMAFAPFLLKHMLARIETLYDLGARKLVVFDLYMGLNLPGRLKELELKLSDSAFAVYCIAKIEEEVKNNPAKYGYTNVKEPCVVVKDKKIITCNNRKEFLLWDKWGHRIKIGHEIAAKNCFNNTCKMSTCTPTIAELACGL